MSDAIGALIRNVKDRIEAKDPAAFEEAVHLTEQYPEEAKVWNTLAYAYEDSL